MPEFPETNHSLIARVKNLADGASWVEFLGIYQPVVFRMARRRGLQDADAQDVIQQVFLSISRSIDGWTAGDDQPPFFLSRTLMMPRPCDAPTTSPPLSIEGNTAMPSAFSMLARGPALSHAAMISSRTVVASPVPLVYSYGHSCAPRGSRKAPGERRVITS